MVAHREIFVGVTGGEMTATVVTPPGGSGPGVLLLQEIFGVNEFVLGKAEALAGLGYVVACPDIFWRLEPRVSLSHDDTALARAFDLVSRYNQLPEDERVSDLQAALASLRALEGVTGPVGILGYCLGGTLAFLTAALGDPDAMVSYYGSGVPDLLDLAPSVTCPSLFVFGGRDEYLPRDRVQSVIDAFAGRPEVEFHVDEEAGHAFENLLAPRFRNPRAAAHSWPVTVDFLRRTLFGDAPEPQC